jgi:hypothetical protein
MEPSLTLLQIFYGDLTPNRAVVHAQLPGGEELGGASLSGFVRGPRCSRGSTLPTTYRLVPCDALAPQGEGQSRSTYTTLITEPIFWSPDWPALYDLTVELRRGSDVIEKATRTIGLRPLTVVGKYLTYAGKTWVLRGVFRAVELELSISQCRETAAALVAPAEFLDERLLTEASEQGVLVVARLTDRAAAAAEVSRLSRFAAAAIAVLPPGSDSLQPATEGNILLAHHLKQGQTAPSPDDIRLVLGEVTDSATFADWARTLMRPVIACRPLPLPTGIAVARGECDRLQRDLAPYGQHAGYIV